MAIPPPLDSGYQLWYFYPSVPGGIAMGSIFLLLTLAHLVFLIKSRKKFCIPLVIGGIFETVGYGARVYAHYKPSLTLPYAMQSLLILLAPILFAASVYMYLGRIIVAVGGEKHSLIPIRFLTKTFVAGDVTCFIIQGAGGGVMSGSKSSSDAKLGERIILAGLILQIVIFFLFIAVAAIFHLRMPRNSWHGQIPWQRSLAGLYAVSLLIATRNTVRAVEYGMGSTGYLLTHEWIVFVFDGAMMALVLIICLSWYFGGVGSTQPPRRDLNSAESQEEKLTPVPPTTMGMGGTKSLERREYVELGMRSHS